MRLGAARLLSHAQGREYQKSCRSHARSLLDRLKRRWSGWDGELGNYEKYTSTIGYVETFLDDLIRDCPV